MATPTADIGLIGLAVMGENLVLNMESRGYTVAVFNRTTSKVDEFVSGRGKGKKFVGAKSPQEFVASLKRPRKVMMLVKAGDAVDATIASVVQYLEPGDILIDGGNTHFPDTTRRMAEANAKGLLYIGTGVSGGEEGALKGPSIMPGGDEKAWPAVKGIFQSIAAKVTDTDGKQAACCDWVGPQGAGHFVKMVHNGIEYGDMQLICESYHLLSGLLGLKAAELAGVFGKWNKGALDSYLIEITSEIFGYVDPETKKPMVDLILDKAGQKGTGKWTIDSATENGIPLTLIAEAVFARCLSAQKAQRVAAEKVLTGPTMAFTGDKQQFINDVEMALYGSKIVSYAQGYDLMAAQAAASKFLGNIKEAFDKNPKLVNLLVDPFFAAEIQKCQAAWRRVISAAVTNGIPVPAMSAALAYFDGYRTARLPANLLQAQRDYFGAHTYERTDKPAGEFFHTNWTGRGGTTASSTYNV
jgi:6-phosphogluconate dehydrogenase